MPRRAGAPQPGGVAALRAMFPCNRFHAIAFPDDQLVPYFHALDQMGVRSAQ